MAGSQLPPLPLLLLVLLLPLIPSDTTQMAANSSSSLSYPTEEGPETSFIMHPSTSSSEADSTTSHPASDSWATATLQPTSLQPELSSHTSSGSPSTELPLTSHSSPPSSISLTTPHWSSTHSNPSTVPSSMSPASIDGTTLASGLGDTGAPELHRDPGVVVAVCLLVSLLLIGSVVMAVRHCHKGVSEFQELDEGLVSRRSSSAHHPME